MLGILVREFKETGVEVFIHDATHMQDLFRVFKKFRLDFEIADIFDQAYQG